MTRPGFMPWARTYLIDDPPPITTGDTVMAQYNQKQRDIALQNRIQQRTQNLPNNAQNDSTKQ